MANRLHNLQQFKDILRDYHVSRTSSNVLDSTKLALLVGPSSAGRNTIIRELQKSNDYHFIVSDTTRKPRVNDGVAEQNGVEYWFRSEDEVLDDLKNGKYLEAAIIHDQQVSGISIRELQKANKEGRVAITDIEVVGAKHIYSQKPDAYIFFIIPPSFEIWMQRMDDRGQLTDEEKKRRLLSAIKEYEEALQNDYYIYVVNDTFIHSVEYIHQRVLLEQHDVERQRLGRDAIERLLVQTTEYIENL